MAKMIFVLVFAIAVAMPLRTVMGQGGWQDLMGQGDLSETLDEAKKAIGAASGAASGQAAFDDYFGGAGDLGIDGGAADSAADGVPADPAVASLADWIDENATTAAVTPPLAVDSPIGQPDILPAPTPEGSETDDDDDTFAPGLSPGYEYRSPSNAPKVIPESPDDDATKAIPEGPEGDVTKVISEAPEDDSDIDDIRTPADAPIGSPTDAPDGALSSDDEEDVNSPDGAPSGAPEGGSGFTLDDNNLSK